MSCWAMTLWTDISPTRPTSARQSGGMATASAMEPSHSTARSTRSRKTTVTILSTAARRDSTSGCGEEGFPGNLSAKVVFTLTDANELIIEYSATADKDTVINLTNHSYFNLAGQGNGDILGHVLTIPADKITAVDAALIPTGELRPVKGTPFDFTKPTAIGERINQDDPQIKVGRGYDHNWVLTSPSQSAPVVVAEAYDSNSGRVLQVLSTEPGLQFYSGNFLDGTIQGKGGKVYNYRYGFCLETQHFPDSPNHPSFPSTELRPGQKYATTTIFKFSTR